MNPLFSFLGGKDGGGNFVSIILRAVKAAKSGQSANDFIKGLSKEYPELQGLDLDDLEATADLLAKKKGKRLGDLKAQAKDLIQKYT